MASLSRDAALETLRIEQRADARSATWSVATVFIGPIYPASFGDARCPLFQDRRHLIRER